MSTQRKIACLVFPDVMSLDVTGPVQVFASANVELQRQGRVAVYQPLLLGESLEPVASSCGIRLGVDACWHDLAPAELDTLLVPGGQGVVVQRQNPALLAWLRRAEGEVRRLGSVCSGALLLAEAGLLQGHRATTHWADVPSLQRFADVEVQGDRLHTFDPEDAQASHLFTSAGVTAGIDLALALVEADLGRPLALAVAQRLVMFLRRPGGQAQFSPLLTPSAGRVQRLARLLEWIPAHLADDLSIEALAFQAHMTPRTLCRLFKQEVGMGPGRYVEQVRLEAARNLLLDGQASVATTARLTGFGHPENLRRTFQKRLSVSPSELAERFG
ncbi:GlxA family transcriptional regulator [Stutzerimonas balearica]|uniref:Transcriptional regulator n=3 Tax=Pseudomonadaceae TaxID=135621 RepID=A0A8D4C2Y5_9GAMM|nr:DJ-1/PfpI family protein [Stutzerimonas balearica]AJE15290.1 transcriptional regulator [Stutzerimonas balearica DSM 6083]MBD3736404.1 DJ-1/PfpI family protein [Stutzerimonas balearica]SDM26731.1 transcriptional regulator, AraC family with amidase-like domain [Stutzerimonas balearica DSM 6083]